MNRTAINLISTLAITGGAIVLGFEFGPGVGIGVGLIAYGLRNLD